ncbi:MAG: hypothetical protein A3B68_04255 [Candidatus Melainabacteria bacterium RIFCSPHIGHO2_02_FULL_34_12]|nr:MAG: hypothetical protein A3B68_04255 [Candidatus Melainabacteria bacterium RIFCSPHIGHO2_02_FULL_34_12]
MIHLSHIPLDNSIVLFFNHYCGKSRLLDTLGLVFLSVDALRTAILVAFVMGMWEYGRVKKDISANKKVIAILFSIGLTLGIIEILNALIDSPRPIVTMESLINSPLTSSDTNELWRSGWVRNPKHGSFPSDTVALLATLAFGLFSWNKSVGVIAFLFVLFAGVLPRLYFGLHYPSDMFLGILIAGVSTLLIDKIKFFDGINKKILRVIEKYPYIYGVLGFYLFYIIADKFILLRKLPVWVKAMMGN